MERTSFRQRRADRSELRLLLQDVPEDLRSHEVVSLQPICCLISFEDTDNICSKGAMGDSIRTIICLRFLLYLTENL